ALIYHQQGIDLTRTPLPVLGPPYDVPFEFPIFQGIASLVMNVVRPDVAMRLTALASFCLAAALLWLLVRRQAGATPAAIALAFFLFTPFGIVWSRGSLIEYSASAAALGFVLAAILWRAGRGRAFF